MPRKTAGPNARALTKALKALTGLTDEHAAMVEHARQLSNLVDTYPTDIRVHAEYRAALKTLVDVGRPKSQDALSALLIEIRGE